MINCKKPDFIAEEDFPCDVNVTDVLDLTTAEIDRINGGIDLTTLNKRCYDFDPATGDLKGLNQEHIDKVCALEANLETLQETVDNLDIGTELVTVDLGAMTPITNPCSPTTNQYTLFYVLQVFADKLNTL